MRNPLKIACIGEAMCELGFDDDTPRIGFAGDTLNTAIYLRRNCPPEFEVSYVTCVGTDPLSDRLTAFIASEGILTDHIARHPTRNIGLYAIHTAPDGERSFTYWRENSAARTMFEDGFDRLAEFDVLYLSAITLAILPADTRAGLLTFLADFPGTIVFDSNYRPRLWSDQAEARTAITAAWKLCDIALPSLDDEQALFEETDTEKTLSRLRSYGLRKGALKRGPQGPVAIDPAIGRNLDFRPAEKVVDTTAAGDSFNGAYLAARLQGKSEEEAMIAGHECARIVVGFRGAIVPR